MCIQFALTSARDEHAGALNDEPLDCGEPNPAASPSNHCTLPREFLQHINLRSEQAPAMLQELRIGIVMVALV